jgi:hypothetical protein
VLLQVAPERGRPRFPGAYEEEVGQRHASAPASPARILERLIPQPLVTSRAASYS